MNKLYGVAELNGNISYITPLNNTELVEIALEILIEDFLKRKS